MEEFQGEIGVAGAENLTKENLTTQEDVELFLMAGDRYLRLGFQKQELVSIFVKRSDDTQKFPGVTTFLYKAACEVIQEATNLVDHSLTYGFSSANHNMIAWAISFDKGYQIFKWDRMYFEEGRLLAYKNFYPHKSSP